MSSWKMFVSGETTRRWRRLYRNQFTYMPRDSHNLRGYTKRAHEMLDEATDEQIFTLEPNAWLEAFGVSDPLERQRFNERLIERVRHL